MSMYSWGRCRHTACYQREFSCELSD